MRQPPEREADAWGALVLKEVSTVSAPMKAPAEEKVPLMIYLPTALRDRFKALCTANGRSMNSVLTAFVEDVVERHTTDA
jgi:hypothetical protein